MKRNLSLLVLVWVAGILASAQDASPGFEFVFDLNVALSQSINIGTVPQGSRNIIPITGGTFEGPKIHGEIVAGGADYQLHSASTQWSEVHAIYSIRTHDGVNILVDNRGVMCGGDKGWYFYTTPVFSAPVDSEYAWLNRGVFVCKPVGFGKDSITLRVWKVIDGQ